MSNFQFLYKEWPAIFKEAKEAEKRLISDFNEIEEENCQLQRSLVYYKEQQLAVDELQHAIARFEEDSSFWKAKSEEEESIKKEKKIAEEKKNSDC